LLSKVRRGIIDLISSEALEDEARQNPSIERRTEIETLLSLAANTVEIDGSVEQRARTFRGRLRPHSADSPCK